MLLLSLVTYVVTVSQNLHNDVDQLGRDKRKALLKYEKVDLCSWSTHLSGVCDEGLLHLPAAQMSSAPLQRIMQPGLSSMQLIAMTCTCTACVLCDCAHANFSVHFSYFHAPGQSI